MASFYDDPQLYDLLFSAEPFVTFYRDLARRQKGSVLELACGTGQLLIPIASQGIRSVGLDIEPAMVSATRDRARMSKVDVDVIEGDMRNFALTERFALVFVARNSLLHLHTREDFSHFFERVREHLATDGLLAFDIFNPSVSILAQRSDERRFVQRVTHPERGTLTVEETTAYDARSQVNRSIWYISSEGGADCVIAPLHLRSIFPEELLVMLDYYGFKLEARYGDFSSGSFLSSSRQQVCLCRPG